MIRSNLNLLLILFALLGSCTNSSNKNTEEGVKDSMAATISIPSKNILFFGNSLTAGLGVEPAESFPSIIEDKIDSLKLPYKVINAGLSGETTAAGKARINWLLKQPVDVFVLELGANDGLRGIPVTETAKNLQSIIDQVKTKYPNAKLVMTGMQVPPNMGSKYASEFSVIFKQLADKNHMALVPFLLDKVGGIPDLNQSDGIHPTPAGHKIVAENVWLVLKGLL
jgi:acyl-CoA thioesterase-1